MCSDYPWIKLEPVLGTKLNIRHHMLTSSTQLQNSSFHGAERTWTSSKWRKMKNARAKRAKILFFIVKYANLWVFSCRRRGCLSSLILRDVAEWYSWKHQNATFESDRRKVLDFGIDFINQLQDFFVSLPNLALHFVSTIFLNIIIYPSRKRKK